MNTVNTGKGSIIFSIRPFNPVGVSLIHNIVFEPSSKSFIINKKYELIFNRSPLKVYCSSFVNDDAVTGLDKNQPVNSSSCEYGLANAVAVFDINGDGSDTVCRCKLEKADVNKTSYSPDDAVKNWDNILSEGISVRTPDEKLNALFKFSLSTLIMLVDFIV